MKPLKSWLEDTIHYPGLYALMITVVFGILCLFAARSVKRTDRVVQKKSE